MNDERCSTATSTVPLNSSARSTSSAPIGGTINTPGSTRCPPEGFLIVGEFWLSEG
jgi:hypothetical protein